MIVIVLGKELIVFVGFGVRFGWSDVQRYNGEY